jgi:hypothetical protein
MDLKGRNDRIRRPKFRNPSHCVGTAERRGLDDTATNDQFVQPGLQTTTSTCYMLCTTYNGVNVVSTTIQPVLQAGPSCGHVSAVPAASPTAYIPPPRLRFRILYHLLVCLSCAWFMFRCRVYASGPPRRSFVARRV